MFLKRLSAVLVTLTCFGWAALGAAPESLTNATKNGEEKSAMAPMAFPVTNDTVCYGNSNGVLTVTYSGGMIIQSYSILNAAGTLTIPGGGPFNNPGNFFSTPAILPSGIFTIKLTFVGGTYDTSQGTVYQATMPLSLLAQVTNPACSGGTGIIILTPGGGYSPYLYRLRNASGSYMSGVNNVFSNLPAGQYFGEVTDKAGCIEFTSSSLNIVVPPAIATPALTIDSIDFPGEKAVINLSGLPSDPSSYQILLDNVPSGVITGTSAVISNVSAGSHLLKIQSKSCTTDVWPNASGQTINIADYLPITFSWDVDPNSVSIKCFGQDTTLTVTIGGGRVGKTVKLTLLENGIPRELASELPFGSSYPISDLIAGVNYILKVYNTDGLELGRREFQISGTTIPFKISGIIHTNVSCYGGANGSASISFAGGSSPFKYSIDNGASFNLTNPTWDKTIAGLSSKSYNIVLQDTSGCKSDTVLTTIDQPDPISISILTDSTIQLTCPNSNTGKIYARTYGGTKPYYYTLKKAGAVVNPYSNYSGGDTLVFSNLTAGIYEVTSKDSVCPVSVKATETIDSIGVGINITFDPIKCNNGTTDIHVSASGGTGNKFSYNIIDTKTGNPIPTSPKTEIIFGAGVTFSGVLASSYRIQAYYGTCTPTNKDTLIENPQVLNVTFPTTINLKCPGDSALVTIGATGSYPFKISIDGINYTNFINGGTTTVGNLKAGSYSYYVKDKFDCVYNNGLPITIKVDEPTTILYSSLTQQDETCKEKNDGKVTLTVSGGTPGYSVVMRRALDSLVQSSSTGSIEFNNVPAGSYSFKINDNNNCLAPNPPTPIEIKEPTDFTIEDPVIDPIECFNDSTIVIVTASGGWSVTRNIQITGLGYDSGIKLSGSSFKIKAGQYTIQASNSDGCTATRPLPVSEPPQLRLREVNHQNVSCFGEDDAVINIEASGGTPGYTYILGGSSSSSQPFTGSTTAITGIDAGKYDIYVTDSKSCKSDTIPVTITEPDIVEFTYEVDSVTCFGLSDGRIILQAEGGNDNSYRAFLNNQPSTYPVITGLSAGTYSVSVTDSKNCTSKTESVTIGQPSLIVINNANVTDSLSCYNDQDATITINAVGGLPYNLQYKITGRDYQVANKFTVLQSGEYEVWVKNNVGNCEVKYSGKLNIVNPAAIVLPPVVVKTDVSCFNLQDGTVQINATGGTGTLNYLLSGGQSTIPNNPNPTGSFNKLGDLFTTSTTYTYKVDDSKGCFKTGNFTISNPAKLSIEEIDHHQVFCNNDTTGWIIIRTTGGVGKYTYKNDFANTDTLRIGNGEYSLEVDNRIKIKKLTGGNYTPQVIDGNGCKAAVATEISIVNPPPLKIAKVTVGNKRCFDSKDDSTVIALDPKDFGTSGMYKYTINKGIRTNETTELQSTFVNVRDTLVYPMVTDIMGCTASTVNMMVKWPDAFNVEIINRPITCWDNQYGSLITEFKGGIMPYEVGVNDPLFTNNPFTIDKVVPGEVVIDTLRGNSSNGYFYFDRTIGWDIYVKDSNDCVALNTPNTSTSNPYYFKNYKWASTDTFILSGITPSSPNCNYDDAKIEFITNDNGDKPYHYWFDYYDSNTGNLVTKDTVENPILKVPVDVVLTCYVVDNNLCKAYVEGADQDEMGKMMTWVSATNDTIDVKLEIKENENPYSPCTQDGTVRVDITGFLVKGVLVTVFYSTDTINPTYNIFSPSDTSTISSEMADTTYWYEKENGLTHEIIKGEDIYTIFNYPIDYLFTSGYHLIEFKDIKSGCFIRKEILVEPDTAVCEEVYDKFFTPNGDVLNDEWVLNNHRLTNASLKIFNSEGELVYKFPKGGKEIAPAGGLRWNGLDNKGRPVPVGTYMYVYQPDVSKHVKPEYGTITLLRSR